MYPIVKFSTLAPIITYLTPNNNVFFIFSKLNTAEAEIFKDNFIPKRSGTFNINHELSMLVSSADADRIRCYNTWPQHPVHWGPPTGVRQNGLPGQRIWLSLCKKKLYNFFYEEIKFLKPRVYLLPQRYHSNFASGEIHFGKFKACMK